MYIGATLDEYYDAEDTERVCALGAHYELIETRPGGHRKWRVVANPPAPAPTAEELAAQAAAEKAARFAALDSAAIRPLRAIVAGTATPADRDKLAELEAEAEALRKG